MSAIYYETWRGFSLMIQLTCVNVLRSVNREAHRELRFTKQLPLYACGVRHQLMLLAHGGIENKQSLAPDRPSATSTLKLPPGTPYAHHPSTAAKLPNLNTKYPNLPFKLPIIIPKHYITHDLGQCRELFSLRDGARSPMPAFFQETLQSEILRCC